MVGVKKETRISWVFNSVTCSYLLDNQLLSYGAGGISGGK